jgi:hypothetical protein
MFHIKSKYMDDQGTIHKSRYRDGSLRLLFIGNTGTTTLSINLSDYGLEAPEGCFFTKNYSEGEGMAEAIEKAGIAKPIVDESFGRFGTTATLMKLIAA